MPKAKFITKMLWDLMGPNQGRPLDKAKSAILLADITQDR
jgi:hypothetical protein